MPWWVWIALGFFALVLIATGAFALAVFGRVKKLRATGEAIAAQAEEVARRGEELEWRLAHAGERAENVQRHLDRLEASLERASVLSWALGDARKGIARLRGAYLRK